MVGRMFRSALAGSGLGLVGLFAVDLVASEPDAPLESAFSAPIWGDRFPNVLLQTHDGETVRFYDDLIKGKIVALNFMYIGCKDF